MRFLFVLVLSTFQFLAASGYSRDITGMNVLSFIRYCSRAFDNHQSNDTAYTDCVGTIKAGIVIRTLVIVADGKDPKACGLTDEITDEQVVSVINWLGQQMSTVQSMPVVPAIAKATNALWPCK